MKHLIRNLVDEEDIGKLPNTKIVRSHPKMITRSYNK